ncbi:Abi-alpha family protein [Imhoffiella purpurea]|uniref:Abi-alpha family protein n=1 Tax=Imhoffiella purpurea TaxID=1249627 RepID=UPI0012FD7941|nr:hypothetical protein [Imhoffiella purpurea]
MDEAKEIVAKIPKEAWAKLASTACETFEKIIYPLTATTEGIGRLIELRFSKLCDEQKIIAAKCLEEAHEKVKHASEHKKTPRVIKPAVVFESLDNTDNQTDETIRSLWANLLANEFLQGDVHPEIARLLSKITAQDALVLLDVAKNDSISITNKVLRALASTYTLGWLSERSSFNHEYLKSLGLIRELEKNVWLLTPAGRELMRCVSEP